MLIKTIRFFVNFILVLIPFFPLPEMIKETITGDSFSGYLLTCIVISLISIGLGFFIYRSPGAVSANKWPAWLLFLLGPLVMVPLHMGPPKEGPELLGSTAEEKFRYAMLLLAVIIFSAAVIAFLLSETKKNRIILILLVVAFPILIWDNFDSFSFSSKLTDWVNSGKKAEDFFPSYDFHDNWRAIGRMLLYVIAGGLSVLLSGRGIIQKWVSVSLIVFSVIALGFCIAFLAAGPDFYFPFMVPAIAMAPAYWLGLALLNRITHEST